MNRHMPFLLVTAILLSPALSAAGAGWTEAAQVTELEASERGRFLLRVALEKNTSGCRDANGFYADYGREGSELMYRTLLEAMTTAREVQLYATGVCDLDGRSGISAVRLRR